MYSPLHMVSQYISIGMELLLLDLLIILKLIILVLLDQFQILSLSLSLSHCLYLFFCLFLLDFIWRMCSSNVPQVPT